MKMRINIKVLRILIVLVVMIVVGVLAFILISNWEKGQNEANIDTSSQYVDLERKVITYNGETYALRENIETFLVIGIDKFESSDTQEGNINNQQADSIMLVVLNHDSESYTTIQLNRDIMTEINMIGLRGEDIGTFTGQLALSHTYGSGGSDSCRNTVKAVSNLLYGIGIDHYAALTMDAVPVINDLSGGVEITLDEDFSFSDESMQKGSTITLNGEQALVYFRARANLEDSSNLSRMARQRTYINALRTRVMECMKADSGFGVNAILKLSDYMVSDCSASRLSKLLTESETYENLGIKTIDGEAVVGEEFMEYYVDEDALKALVIDCFYEPYVVAEQ